MSGLSPDDYPEYAQFIANKKGTRLGYGARPALILIDVCKAYWTPNSPLDLSSYEKAAQAPESMHRLLEAARAGRCPVIWTQQRYTHPNLKDAGLFIKKAAMLDINLVGDQRGLGDFMDGLQPEKDEVIIHKKYPSAFFGTNLMTQLHILNVDTLIICGVSTSGCVRATALDTMQSGLRPIVVSAACGDRPKEVHFSNLFDINAKYGDVVAEGEAIEKLKAGWD